MQLHLAAHRSTAPSSAAGSHPAQLLPGRGKKSSLVKSAFVKHGKFLTFLLVELFKGQILIDPLFFFPSFRLLLPSSPGVDTVSSSQSFASRCRARTASIAAVNLHYLHSVPISSKTVQHSRLDCENQSSVTLNRQECNPLTPGQNTELSPCLSPPNPQPVCLRFPQPIQLQLQLQLRFPAARRPLPQ